MAVPRARRRCEARNHAARLPRSRGVFAALCDVLRFSRAGKPSRLPRSMKTAALSAALEPKCRAKCRARPSVCRDAKPNCRAQNKVPRFLPRSTARLPRSIQTAALFAALGFLFAALDENRRAKCRAPGDKRGESAAQSAALNRAKPPRKPPRISAAFSAALHAANAAKLPRRKRGEVRSTKPRGTFAALSK